MCGFHPLQGSLTVQQMMWRPEWHALTWIMTRDRASVASALPSRENKVFLREFDSPSPPIPEDRLTPQIREPIESVAVVNRRKKTSLVNSQIPKRLLDGGNV